MVIEKQIGRGEKRLGNEKIKLEMKIEILCERKEEQYIERDQRAYSYRFF